MPDPMPGLATEPAGRESSARRLWDSLLHPRRSQAIAGVLLAIVGFGAVTQVRTNTDDSTYTGYSQQDLINVLSGLSASSQRAQNELAQLQHARRRLQSATDQRQAALQQAESQVDSLSVLAGTVPVTGPGIVIRVAESTGQVNVDSFLDLIEELRSAGAEAIQINGKVRLVAQSSFEQGVDGLYVDKRLLTPPYTIDAIGEPATLQAAVTFARGPEYELQQDGATVTVQQSQSLDIRSVRKQ